MAAQDSLQTGRAVASASERRLDPKWVIIGGTIVVVAVLTLTPLGFLLWQSFSTAATAAKPAEPTLQNYLHVFTSDKTGRVLWNSIVFAFGTSILALVIGTLFAWLNERTNTPFKVLFYAASIVPLIVPSILFAVSWVMLTSPKIGLFNLVLKSWFGLSDPVFDIYSMGGMIWVEGLHYAPIAFLMMSSAFRSMDPSLEESAMMSGASIPQIAWRITFRLAWPSATASFLVLFILSIESFEVPALLGMPANIDMITTTIYEALKAYPSNVGSAAAHAVLLLIIAGIGIYFQTRLSGQGGRFSTVTGKGFRPRPMDLGKWRIPAAILVIVYMAFAIVLPFLVLLWSSLNKYYSVPSWNALNRLSFGAYVNVLNYPAAGRALWNSVGLAIGTATLVMLLTAVICWIVIRTRLPGRWLLDMLASLPMVFPGIVLGLAVMVCFLYVNIGIYGTIWIIFIAYVIRFMPYGMRYNTTSMLQIHKDLEESAAMSGASWSATFRRIVLPLLKPGLLAGWTFIVVVSIRELSSSVLLYSPGSEVLSIVIWELWLNGQYVELSAFGVMMIVALFAIVMLTQLAGRSFGVKGA